MNLIFGILFLLIAAVADARAIYHATKCWSIGRLVRIEFLLTLLFFLSSITPFVYSIKFFQKAGITSQTLQSLLWFATTVIFISLLDKSILTWTKLDQTISIIIALGLGVLIYRVS